MTYDISDGCLNRHTPDEDAASGVVVGLAQPGVGADHMVMGSDYPHLLGSIDKAVSSIEAMNIPDLEKQGIFSGTALSILNNV